MNQSNLHSLLFVIHSSNEGRALSYIHEEDNISIITYPIFSQALSTSFPLLQDIIAQISQT